MPRTYYMTLRLVAVANRPRTPNMTGTFIHAERINVVLWGYSSAAKGRTQTGCARARDDRRYATYAVCSTASTFTDHKHVHSRVRLIYSWRMLQIDDAQALTMIGTQLRPMSDAAVSAR
jgi:hypothetical protein